MQNISIWHLKTRIFSSILLIIAVTTGCQRSSDEVWNDTQSAGRHVSRGIQTLGGKHGDSRQIANSKDFAGNDDAYAMQGTQQNDFIALEDERQDLSFRVSEEEIPSAKDTPGDLGSRIPGIDAFRDPSMDPQLARIFQNISFDYNSSLVRGDDNLRGIANIANYLKSHPGTCIFIEGHCDSRGPAAYNFALGANRSNSVRNILVKEGVDLNTLFTVSYGKERPLVDGEGEEVWRRNRRAQFKVLQE